MFIRTKKLEMLVVQNFLVIKRVEKQDKLFRKDMGLVKVKRTKRIKIGDSRTR